MGRVTNPVMSGAKVTLADADVTGLRLEPIRRVAVRGRVVAPRGVTVQGLSVSAIMLISEGPSGPGSAGVVGADGNFEFYTFPRRVIVRVSEVVKIPGGTRGLRRSAVVRINGVDVTRTGVDIQPGRDVGRLVIELGR